MLIGRVGDRIMRPVEALTRLAAHFSPNMLTITGLALNGVACACFALAGGKDYVSPGLLRAGGVVVMVASLFDMMDGRVARLRGRESKFGAFLDSTMDRYSDMVIYMGLLILYARLDRTPLMVLVWVAAFGSFMTSYARARAEGLIERCDVGLLERPERIALVVLGALGSLCFHTSINFGCPDFAPMISLLGRCPFRASQFARSYRDWYGCSRAHRKSSMSLE